MRRRNGRWVAAMALVLCLVTAGMPRAQAKALDEIEKYHITVDMRQDGTMDMQYDISWRVLDSTSAGPLSWVHIGIPNSHVDEVKALTDNIASARYDGGSGSFVRVNFAKDHWAGETVQFSFSIHQSYMYTIESDGSLRYEFTPGWFDEIKVDELLLRWNDEKMQRSDAMRMEDGYAVWEKKPMLQGERLKASVYYPAGAFTVDDEQQYVDESASGGTTDTGDTGENAPGIGTAIIVAMGLGIAGVVWWIGKDDDNYHGGFGGGYHGGGYHGGCACASSCACACACACAGGGRAGCSAKNFYGAAIDVERLRRSLEGAEAQAHDDAASE